MGTRGVIGFRVDGEDKVTYNHSDSYPEHLGDAIATFVGKTSNEVIAATARGLVLVKEEGTPTPAQIEETRPFHNLSVGDQKDTDWYCCLRDAQGDLFAYTARGLKYMIDSHNFLGDSLFCEYAYIINVDTGKLEFYRGFNKAPGGAGRYAALQEPPYKGAKSEYFGVVLVGEWPLDEVRKMGSEELVGKMERLALSADETVEGE
jgi:hypothetical protein